MSTRKRPHDLEPSLETSKTNMNTRTLRPPLKPLLISFLLFYILLDWSWFRQPFEMNDIVHEPSCPRNKLDPATMSCTQVPAPNKNPAGLICSDCPDSIFDDSICALDSPLHCLGSWPPCTSQAKHPLNHNDLSQHGYRTGTDKWDPTGWVE